MLFATRHFCGSPTATVRKGASYWGSPAPGAFCISVWLAGWDPEQSTRPCRAPPPPSAQMSPSPSWQHDPLHPKRSSCEMPGEKPLDCRRAPETEGWHPGGCLKKADKASKNGSLSAWVRSLLLSRIVRGLQAAKDEVQWGRNVLRFRLVVNQASIWLSRASCFLPHSTSPSSIPLSAGCRFN